MGVDYEAAQRLKARHTRNLKKRKLLDNNKDEMSNAKKTSSDEESNSDKEIKMGGDQNCIAWLLLKQSQI